MMNDDGETMMNDDNEMVPAERILYKASIHQGKTTVNDGIDFMSDDMKEWVQKRYTPGLPYPFVTLDAIGINDDGEYYTMWTKKFPTMKEADAWFAEQDQSDDRIRLAIAFVKREIPYYRENLPLSGQPDGGEPT